MKAATVSPEQPQEGIWIDPAVHTTKTSSSAMAETITDSGHTKPKHLQSLIGFDPLLTPTSVSAATSVDLSFSSGAPPVPSLLFEAENGTTTCIQQRSQNTYVDDRNVPNESTFSPSPSRIKRLQLPSPSSATKLFRKTGSKTGHRKTKSLTSNGVLSDTNNSRINSGKKELEKEAPKQDNGLSPPRPVRRTASASQSVPSVPLFGGAQRMLPWQKRKSNPKEHRKTNSVSSASDSNNSPYSVPPQSVSASSSPYRVPPQSMSVSSSPVVNESNSVASMSPMIQELYKLEKEQQQEKQSLFLPSLAKPRPTSFLTGQLDEAFRSSEQDPTPWQLEIPGHNDVLVEAKLNQFLETYAVNECPLNFNQLVGVPRMEMQHFARGDDVKLKGVTDTIVAECHRPVVESLLECGSDISEVKGFFTSGGEIPDNRREVLVVERQNKFVCVFRGSAAEQQGKFPRQSESVKLGDDSAVSVYGDRFNAFAALQGDLFRLLDQLAEESPFCDITFTGHAYGAAIATLAAYTYANCHSDLRVACHVTACPRLSHGDFRSAVHSSPNLNVWRTELGRHFHRWSVGHCARLNAPKDGKGPTVQAFKFGLENSHTESLPIAAGASVVRSFLAQGKDRGIHEYIDLLEDMGPYWSRGFYREDGKGVRGKDNEAREMA